MSFFDKVAAVTEDLRTELRAEIHAEIWEEAWSAGFQAATLQIVQAARSVRRKAPPRISNPIQKGEFTEERIQVVKDGYAEGLTEAEIYARVNALPGVPIKFKSLLRWALKLGVDRTPHRIYPNNKGRVVPADKVTPVVLVGDAAITPPILEGEAEVRPPLSPKKAEPKPHVNPWTPDRIAYLARVVPLGLPMARIMENLNGLAGPLLSSPKIRDRIVSSGLKFPTFSLTHQCEKIANDGERDGLDTDEILMQLETLVRNYRATQVSPKKGSGFSMLGGSAKGVPASILPSRPIGVSRTKDGMISVAETMMWDSVKESQSCLATWKTAMDWAEVNRVPTDGTEQEALARVNRVRSNMNLPIFEIRG